MLMEVFSSYELLWRSMKQVVVQIDLLPGILQDSLDRGLKIYIYIYSL